MITMRVFPLQLLPNIAVNSQHNNSPNPLPTTMVLSSPSSSFFLILIIFLLIELHKSIEATYDQYQNCKEPFECGNITVSYPFYDGQNRPDYCGYPGFEIDCSNSMPEISMTSQNYYILSMNSTSHTISVAREDYWNNFCPQNLSNTNINFTLFKYTTTDQNVTLYYNCSSQLPTVPNFFSCPNTNNIYGYIWTQYLKDKYGNTPVNTCQSNISVPAYQAAVVSIVDPSTLMAAFRGGFGLQWIAQNGLCDDCRGSGGVCGFNATQSRFTCYCPDQSYDHTCSGANKKARNPRFALIASFSAIGICISVALIFYFVWKPWMCTGANWNSSNNHRDIEAFLRKQGSLAPKRYKYTDLKKITNSFKEKLGEGGYATVYRGKLQNGNLVAVKIMKKSKGNAKDFINEVASIGRTNHVNIVRLLGFCFEGHNRRALVYELMPNGSLEKFIYGGNNHESSLSWEKLFEIAVGIARGLEYLHRGCNTRILHFDIKPHNILLDEDFNPKISDFGLAKSCPQKESMISMSGARGTVGYIAPEVFLKGFGGVSYKSDVYSYGMLVLEMTGCRRNNGKPIVDDCSEEYFPEWIYKQLEQDEHQGILNGEEKYIEKKLILVSLWCIQTNPSSRPAMSKVVEMLEGSLESLQTPPIPTLSSPPRSQPRSSTPPTISL